MAAQKARGTVCLAALLLHSVPTATSIKVRKEQVNTSAEAERSACAAYAGEYQVWYQGGRRSTNMVISCDCTASQPGIFTDYLRFNSVSTQCPGVSAQFYILNTHGSGKYECLSQSGTTISGYHYTSWQAYWGTIEYRLISSDSS